eukprot:TRINITY_DN7545_c0_g1_i1.p1 TRINITY_DN7545_c0_g1~~TRINITY_DN7545_c0_g1_i1.p1  ORF type:complete len:315 (-),score=67.35 TRINITY_DN7545_c0_g1_i1:22-966(-)
MENDLLVKCEEWDPLSSHNTFSIASFNTLRRNEAFIGKYWVSLEARKWENRRKLHIELLKSLKTDLICLQEAEMNTFEEDFGFAQELGYEVVKPKGTKKQEDPQHGHTKPSIFYNPARMKLVWHNPRSRMVLAAFEFLETPRLVFVMNVHLQGGRQEDQRLYQIKSGFKELEKFLAKEHLAKEGVHLVLCGDFNATLEHLVHQFLRDGAMAEGERSKVLGAKAHEFDFRHTYKLSDAYGALPERPYTIKWGVHRDAQFHAIDFIYYSSNTLKLRLLRDTVPKELKDALIQTEGLPSQRHPSDHLPIAAQFIFNE